MTNESNNVDFGILMPALSHKWRLLFTGSAQIARPSNILTQQVVRCNLDMVNKKAKITIEQSILGEEYYQLENLHEWAFSLRMDVLNGNDQIYYSIMFNKCNITKHEHNFDYADSKCLSHELEISYTNYDILIPATESELPIEPTQAVDHQ